MSCFSSCNCRIDSFIVSHLSHENNIRIFTKCWTKCCRKIRYISSYLSLMYHRFLKPIYILYRIFYCYNMSWHIVVNIINHSCKCCRLTTSCRTCYKNKSGSFLNKLRKKFSRMSQFFKRRYNRIKKTDTRCKISSLMIYINS